MLHELRGNVVDQAGETEVPQDTGEESVNEETEIQPDEIEEDYNDDDADEHDNANANALYDLPDG